MSIEKQREDIREFAHSINLEEGFLGAMRKLKSEMPEDYELRYDLNGAVVVFANDMIVLRIVPDRDWYGYTRRLLVIDECKLLSGR